MVVRRGEGIGRFRDGILRGQRYSSITTCRRYRRWFRYSHLADVDLPVLSVLPDGSWISRVADPAASRRLRRKRLSGKDIPGVQVRVIEYSLSGDPEHPLGAGAESELFCLAVTLTDPQAYPMDGFPDLYHDRWQLETAIGDVETRLRGGPDVVLRSKSPDLVRQDVDAHPHELALPRRAPAWQRLST